MSDYYTESQVNRIEEDAYNGAIFEAGKEWERQRDEFDSREHELEARIAELKDTIVRLKGFVNELIEAGNDVALVAKDILEFDGKSGEFIPIAENWQALVKDWKEG